MPVCFLVSLNGLSNAGGVERVCFYVDGILRERGYDVRLVDRSLIESWAPVRWYRRLFGRLHSLAFPAFASWYIRTHKMPGDIAIANGFNAPFQTADYLIVHGNIHGYYRTVSPEKNSLRIRVMTFYERTAVRRANVLLVVSQYAYQETLKYYLKSPKKVYVVNNTVDVDLFYPLPRRQRPITILYSGRLDYGKGLEALVSLAERVEQTDNFRFRITTNNSNNADRFQSLRNTCIQIGLTIENMNEFYNSGDILFFPSMYEGFEMVTLEALSAGIPVIGNPVGAIRELVSKNEPGVDLISRYADVITGIETLTSRYASDEQRDFLHGYYAQHYGLETYRKRVLEIIG